MLHKQYKTLYLCYQWRYNANILVTKNKQIKIEYFNASRKMQYFTFYGQKLHVNANGRYLVDNGEVLSLFYIAINKISHTCKSINKFYGQFYFHQKKQPFHCIIIFFIFCLLVLPKLSLYSKRLYWPRKCIFTASHT